MIFSVARLCTHPFFFDLGNTLVLDRAWAADAPEALTELNRHGFKLGIISNTGKLSRAELTSLLPADFRFDLFGDGLILLSSEVGLQKPDPAIFRLAIKRAHTPAAKCLFCTEDLRDTLAAQKTGLHAIRLPNSPDGVQANWYGYCYRPRPIMQAGLPLRS